MAKPNTDPHAAQYYSSGEESSEVRLILCGGPYVFTPIFTETNHIFFYSFKTELNIYIFVIFFLFILFKEIFFLHAHFHVSRIFLAI